MVNYPNGQKKPDSVKKQVKAKNLSAANRGMGLEKFINDANLYYSENNIAVITKRPTPINVVKINYARGAQITNAYFEKQSTTDYNGIYLSKYLDFEAKSTKLKTSFPLSNIYPHQIEHLKKVLSHGGIAFFIVEFISLNEYILMAAKDVIAFYEEGLRKSIPYAYFKEKGKAISLTFNPILNYLPYVKEMFNL